MRTAAASSTKRSSKDQSRGRANGFFALLYQLLIVPTQLLANAFNLLRLPEDPEISRLTKNCRELHFHLV
jgi:hypothetical protein